MSIKEGFSLPELLITLAIVILLSAFILPTYKIFIVKSQAQVLSVQLLRALNLARSEAMLRGVAMTLCGSVNHVSCTGDWQAGQIIFVDEKQDGVVIDKEHVAYVFDAVAREGMLRWRSALGRSYLQLRPTGDTFDNGTFWYCARQEKTPRWAIVISQSGRPRLVEAGTELSGLEC